MNLQEAVALPRTERTDDLFHNNCCCLVTTGHSGALSELQPIDCYLCRHVCHMHRDQRAVRRAVRSPQQVECGVLSRVSAAAQQEQPARALPGEPAGDQAAEGAHAARDGDRAVHDSFSATAGSADHNLAHMLGLPSSTWNCLLSPLEHRGLEAAAKTTSLLSTHRLGPKMVVRMPQIVGCNMITCESCRSASVAADSP